MRINAEALRAKRMARGLTQESLAVRVGLSDTSIGNLETGVYGGRPSTLRKLAEALGCSIADIAVGETAAEVEALEQERADVPA